MCGRFYIAADDHELWELFSALPDLKTGEIFPTDPAPVLSAQGDALAMRWGFPGWDGKRPIINARSETAAVTRMFQIPMREGRCLIPASWYFEWRKLERGKQRYAIRPRGAQRLYLAGLWRQERETGERRFVVLTRAAAPGIAFIHERMPVLLPPEQHDRWLHAHDPQPVLAAAAEDPEYWEA